MLDASFLQLISHSAGPSLNKCYLKSAAQSDASPRYRAKTSHMTVPTRQHTTLTSHGSIAVEEHGQSSNAPDATRSYTRSAFADAAEAVVFGWSLGGHIGIEMVSRPVFLRYEA
jgi:hypothetical protein